MPITLMYHDVVEDACADASGFVGPGSRRYKLPPAQFRAHIHDIDRVLKRNPITTNDGEAVERPDSVLLTFDDGGVSCHGPVADVLDRMGWRGHFFIPTDHIGSPGFITPGQIRSLHVRGHG